MLVDHKISEEINLIRHILTVRFDVRQILLFGSFAYGEPDADSDIDICVILPFLDKRKIEIIREMRRALADFISNPLDILLYPEHEFHKRSLLPGSLEHKILNQGIKIYEQPGVSAGMV